MATYIFVENQRHELHRDEITAAQIRALGNIPDDNHVFRETPGDDPDPEVPAGSFEVREGEKFYAVPPGNFGLVVATDAEAEIAGLIAEHGGEVKQTPDGQRWLVLDRFVLGPAWNPPVSKVAIRITGYPEAALDGFCIPATVMLLSGAQPTATSPTAVFGAEVWWNFSYHPVSWRMGRHTLRSYIGFIRQRLQEGR
ncbi:MAG: E2/UBC family protein [Candidatus Dormibacter sp.]